MFANVMASKGYSVAVAERHFKPGGYATNFMRQRRQNLFDCSLHKITGLGPGGNLRNALVRSGLWDELRFELYQDLTSILVEDRVYHLPAEQAGVRQALLAYFPDDADGLREIFQDIATHGYQNYMFARMAIGEYSIVRELLEGSRALSQITALAYFQSRLKTRDLIALLSTLAINLGVVADEIDALYFLHFAYTFLSTGVGFVRGTSQSLSDRLAHCLVRRGGRIFLRQPAERIEVQDGEVVALETRSHRFVTRDIVATCSPHVVRDLLPPNELGDKFGEQLGKLTFGLGTFTVYLVLDRPPAECGLVRSEYLIADPDPCPLTDAERQNDRHYQRWPLSVTNYHLLDPIYGNVVQAVILDPAGRWFELNRPAYREHKQQVQEQILQRVARYFPQLMDHVVYQEASTPATNYKYTGSPSGSAFGYKAVPGRNLRFLQRPRLKGLSLIGTWINGAGYEPALCLGFTHAYLRPAKAG